MKNRLIGAVLGGLLFWSAACTVPEPTPFNEPPRWAQEAIWYQIFVERFRNGDPNNDPTRRDIIGSWPHVQPENWRVTPWTHDWYAREDWWTNDDFYFNVQIRRYGGDLQGVLDQLDYLSELGITAIYLNPVNDSPSLHKYDARSYHHVDRNFGPDPTGDEALIATETPTDPATWTWTSADQLLLKLIEEVHARDMKIILDYSWNHTGIRFWAWQDVLENQDASPYADWYEIDQFDDPATPEDEFAYTGWYGVRELPELKKITPETRVIGHPFAGDLHPEVKAHVYAVTRRWMDPNGDGDPSDGIDGFRLDVAEMVPVDFWRDYRTFVRGINPEAYLVGEVWWEQWPDKMADPTPYLQGDIFDAVMHYRWYMPTRSFFANTPRAETAQSYMAHLDSIAQGLSLPIQKGLMNLTASHDSPRFSTSIYNPKLYKYQAHPSHGYTIDRPDEHTRELQRMILIQQFTYIGAPHIWNGDEVGMWGADDPDQRKPLVWADLTYEDEVTHPYGAPRKRDAVAPDTTLFRFYQQLIALRKANPVLVHGGFTVLLTDDVRGVLAYQRTLDAAKTVVAFNKSPFPQTLTIETEGTFTDPLNAATSYTTEAGQLIFTLPPFEALILMRE